MPQMIWLAMLLLSFSVSASPKEWDHLVDSYVKELETKLKAKNIPGAALSIVKSNHSSVAIGLGTTKVKKGHAVTANTRFRLASVSKTFAGSLAAKLASEGAFALNDPVAKYLPAFHFDSYDKKLRLYHLLSHSSGLVPNAYDNLIESRMNYPDIQAKLSEVKPMCAPGSCYGYQNVMFSLIGDITQQSTGLSYETWLNEIFFKPLNMKNASVGYDAMVADDDYALPHVMARKRWHTAKLKKDYYKVAPAAGVNASASDMVQWLKAQLGQYPAVLNESALSKQVKPYTKTKKEMSRRVWRKKLKNADYGLGWRIYDYAGETLYYHSGWVQGYRADIVIVPRLEIGFSLMINAEAGIINELTTDFIDEVLASKVNKRRI
ncbi:beta-lactamase class C [Pseudoalteromonas tunicata]|nr:beta-lactamase class C [Pseudoalteromonas tunicata]